jgi:hypothetical protein
MKVYGDAAARTTWRRRQLLAQANESCARPSDELLLVLFFHL